MTTGNKLCSIPRVCGKAAATKDYRRRKMLVAVFEDTDKNPKPQRHNAAMGSAHGASIRVCKGRLTSACNPGVCDCPDEACKLKKTKAQILMAILKYAIFGLAVEETIRYGIWSDASKTDALTARYLDWAEQFFPTRNKIKRTPQEVYDMARIRYNLRNVWNNIIINVNDFVVSIPQMIERAVGYFMGWKVEEVVEVENPCELNLGILDDV